VNDRPDAYELARESVERGAALPDSAMGRMSGCSEGVRRRDFAMWDEGGPGSEVETVPAWINDGWGWLNATSAEWDRIEVGVRAFTAGAVDAIHGEQPRSEDRNYLAGYEAHKETR
jgi:hypothetical protein